MDTMNQSVIFSARQLASRVAAGAARRVPQSHLLDRSAWLTRTGATAGSQQVRCLGYKAGSTELTTNALGQHHKSHRYIRDKEVTDDQVRL